MEIEVSAQEFINLIGATLRSKPQEHGKTYIFQDIHPEKKLVIELSDIEDILQVLATKEEIEDTGIYDSCSYEVLVNPEFSYLNLKFRFRDDELIKQDEDNEITYKLSRPSDEYILFLLYKVSKITSLIYFLGPTPIKRILGSPKNHDINYNTAEVLKLISSKFITLRVESKKKNQLQNSPNMQILSFST